MQAKGQEDLQFAAFRLLAPRVALLSGKNN